MRRPWKYRIGELVVGILASALLGTLAFAFVVFVWPGPTLIGPTGSATNRMRDRNNVRQLCELLTESGTLPMKDGALDPYVLFRRGVIVGRNIRLFRSDRSGVGPTEEEVARGDYTNFPWERYRGDGKLGGTPFPLLWEKTPDDQGKVLVGLSDGMSAYWDEARLESTLREAR